MNVLLASPFGGIPGGISRWTSHILNHYESLSEKPCKITLLPMGRSTFVNINSNIAYRLYSAMRDYRSILSEYRKKISEDRYDILHLASSASISLIKDIYMIRKAKAKGIKTILHFHFGRIPELAIKKNWEWKLLIKVIRITDKVVVLDHASYETLRLLGFDHVEILPNPLAPEVNSIVEQNKSISREENTILFTGHVVRTKGVFELLDACNELKNIKLKYVGHVEDEIKETLYNKAKCNVEVIGELPYEEVIKEMLKCDIFVLPTYTEGFPNVILESMAAGCSIITTDVGAIPQMLDSTEGEPYALIVKPRNADVLRNAIELLRNDETFKESCRRNVQQRVNAQYSIEKVWFQIVSMWCSLLKS